MRIIPKCVADWLREDPHPNDIVQGRVFSVHAGRDGFVFSVRFIDCDNRRHTIYAQGQENESSISGGGSSPTACEKLILDANLAARCHDL